MIWCIAGALALTALFAITGLAVSRETWMDGANGWKAWYESEHKERLAAQKHTARLKERIREILDEDE